MRPAARALLCFALLTAPVALAACGGRATVGSVGGSQRSVGTSAALSGTGTGSDTTTTTSAAGAGSLGATLPSLPAGNGKPVTTTTVPHSATQGAVNSTQKAIMADYESYLVDLSGLDDNLSKAWVAPLASVTTNRLAQASVRQAATLLAAQEHGVGTLRDDHLTVVMTGPASAALADCQDEDHFYLASDNGGATDPFVERGYFVGSAQMVLQSGHWLVDVFTTTHVTCAAF
jgi:hypothetical protein